MIVVRRQGDAVPLLRWWLCPSSIVPSVFDRSGEGRAVVKRLSGAKTRSIGHEATA